MNTFQNQIKTVKEYIMGIPLVVITIPWTTFAINNDISKATVNVSSTCAADVCRAATIQEYAV